MRHVEVRESIQATPAEIHAFVSDFRRYPEWIPFTKEVTSVEPKPGVVGTKYTERGTGGKSAWEVVEYEKGRREVHVGDIGVARVRIEMRMKPGDQGTDYTHIIEYTMKVPVIGFLIDRLVLGRNMRKGTAKMVANLKRIVEAEGTGGPTGQRSSTR